MSAQVDALGRRTTYEHDTVSKTSDGERHGSTDPFTHQTTIYRTAFEEKPNYSSQALELVDTVAHEAHRQYYCAQVRDLDIAHDTARAEAAGYRAAVFWDTTDSMSASATASCLGQCS